MGHGPGLPGGHAGLSVVHAVRPAGDLEQLDHARQGEQRAGSAAVDGRAGVGECGLYRRGLRSAVPAGGARDGADHSGTAPDRGLSDGVGGGGPDSAGDHRVQHEPPAVRDSDVCAGGGHDVRGIPAGEDGAGGRAGRRGRGPMPGFSPARRPWPCRCCPCWVWTWRLPAIPGIGSCLQVARRPARYACTRRCCKTSFVRPGAGSRSSTSRSCGCCWKRAR